MDKKRENDKYSKVQSKSADGSFKQIWHDRLNTTVTPEQTSISTSRQGKKDSFTFFHLVQLKICFYINV